ncbi:MAG: hypothetical protein GX096_06365 [Clostridiales bacterium]|nr:hypothetical protein [Clostridiales bacterium]
MMKKTKRYIALIVLCLLMLIAAAALGESVMIGTTEMSFSVPLVLQPEELPADAVDAGVRYAAQNADGSLRFVLIVKAMKRGGDMDISALIARAEAHENVTVEESVTADGAEFVISSETLRSNGEDVIFRMATATAHGKQLMLFFIDQAGNYPDITKEMVSSITFREEVQP